MDLSEKREAWIAPPPPPPARIDPAGNHTKAVTSKRGPGLVIEYAFALVIAGMMLTMGAAFCYKFWLWVTG